MLWVGALLAIIPAVLLAYVPHLPTANRSQAPNLASGSIRITGSTNRRLRVFAVVQIAASFMLLAGASMLLKTLISLQTAQTGLDMQHVLAINVPVMKYDKTPQQVVDFYKDRSEEHTSELQSQSNLVCRLLLEKKKKILNHITANKAVYYDMHSARV